jgi:Lon-like ATP-dependent protease
LEPGLLREANGGYLILQLDELLDQPHLWFKLKNAMQKASWTGMPIRKARR